MYFVYNEYLFGVEPSGRLFSLLPGYRILELPNVGDSPNAV